MTIEQTAVVDFARVDLASGQLVLLISDHLPWSDEQGTHLYLLQEKVNAYLRFIESGEIGETLPESRGRNVVIKVVGKFELSDQAKLFYERVRQVVVSAGIEFAFTLFQPK